MGCFFVELNRLGNTPTPTLERVGATPTAEVEYLGGVPIASLIGLGDTPTAVLEHLGGMNVSGSLLCYVGNDTLAISETSLSFTSEDVGVQKTFIVFASSAWTAELIDPDGLFSISRDGGLGGVGTRMGITLIKANPNIENYSASVVFKSRGLRQTLGIVAEASVSYVPLTYIEATGAQYFDLDYVVKETDVIEMFYRNPFVEEADKFYFGIVDGDVAMWVDIYNNTGYIRFGQTSSTVERGGKLRDGTLLRLKKNSFEVNNTEVLTLPYAGMPSLSLIMFANKTANGVYGYSDVRCRWFRIYNEAGELEVDLHPRKRNNGAIGLLDKVSGKFYVSESDTPFVAGDEINITDGYELIDYVTFNADKLFDAGYINSDDSVACQFVSERTGQYVYGAISSPHTATISLYTGSANWRWGSTYLSRTTNNNTFYTTEQTNGSVMLDYTTVSRTKSSDFTTAYSMPLGGYVSASGAYTPNFIGKVYHFAIKNGDTLLKDWWPCKRKSDGVEGFWDNVSKTFVESI